MKKIIKPLNDKDVMNLEIKGFEIVNRKKRIVKRKEVRRIEVREIKKCETLPSVCREMKKRGGYIKSNCGTQWLVVER